MIDKLELKNFKSARSLSLRIGPLTVLSGLNGSGKSTVLQSIGVLKQTLDSDKLDGLRLRGNLVRLGRCEDVHFDGADTNDLEIIVSYNQSKVEFLAIAEKEADILPLTYKGDAQKLREHLNNWFQFIQADRLTPAVHYDQASTPDRLSETLGSRGEFTIDFLQRNSDRRVSKNRMVDSALDGVTEELLARVAPTPTLADQTAAWMQLLSPGVRFQMAPVALTELTTLRYQYAGSSTEAPTKLRRPSNVGFGLTYCLPIIVSCLAAKPGALLLLENPEAHLHPQGQAALGTLLARCAADGVQIIVETHSDHILNGIRVAVRREERVRPEHVCLHFFSRNLNSGETSTVSPNILPDGQLDAWPVGFFDQWDRSLDRLLD
jgi:predicted ATPase